MKFKGEIGFKEQMAYCSIEVGVQFVWTMISTYLSVFYTDVVGLAPAIVSIILLIARIWDGVNDPMMGIITEKTHFKGGKFKPYLKFGAPLVAVCSILTFSKLSGSGSGVALYAAITYICCGMAYTIVCIAQGGLVNLMTRDLHTRNQLNSMRQLGSGITGMVISAIAMPLILALGDGTTSSSRGYFLTNVLFAILGCVCILFGGIVCKERVKVAATAETEQKGSVKDTFLFMIRNKDILLLIICAILTASSVLGRYGIVSYWFIYYIGSATMMASVMVCYNIAKILVQFAVPFLVAKLGKKYACMSAYCVQVIGLLFLFFFASKGTVFVYIGSIIVGASEYAPPVLYSIIGELCDREEVRSGKRSDGMIYSLNSLGTKIGIAIGGSVGVSLLGAVGYVANAEQSASTLFGMNVVTNIVPLIFACGAALCVFFMGISDKKAEEYKRILEEREAEREAKAA